MSQPSPIRPPRDAAEDVPSTLETEDSGRAEQLADVRTELRRRAFLHDDPGAYQAGVDDALAELGGKRRD